MTKSIASHARRVARRLQDEEDRRVGMVVADRADRVEAREIVLVRRVVAVPCDDVERRMVDRRRPQVALELGRELEAALAILVPRMRREEVARIGKAVAADHAEIRQPEVRAVVLAHVTARSAIRKLHAKADAARNDGDLARRHLEPAELRQDVQRALLRHDEELAVGIVEKAVRHRAVGRVEVDREPRHRLGAAVACHGHHAVDEIGGRIRHRQRIPAQLVGRRGHVVEAARDAMAVRETERLVHDAGADAVGPGAPVRMARRRERGAGDLLGIQAVRDALRRILAHGKRAFACLGRELVAEARLIPEVVHVRPSGCAGITSWRAAVIAARSTSMSPT